MEILDNVSHYGKIFSEELLLYLKRTNILYEQRKCKCYKCGKRGHIAKNCNKICVDCGDISDHKICFKQIMEAVKLVRELPIYINKEKFYKINAFDKVKQIRESLEFLRKGEDKVKLYYKRIAEKSMPSMQISRDVQSEVNNTKKFIFFKLTQVEKARLYEEKYEEARKKYLNEVSEDLYKRSSFKNFLEVVVPSAYLNKMVLELDNNFNIIKKKLELKMIEKFPNMKFEDETREKLIKLNKEIDEEISKLKRPFSKEKEKYLEYSRKLNILVTKNELNKLDKLFKKSYRLKGIKKKKNNMKFNKKATGLLNLIKFYDKITGIKTKFVNKRDTIKELSSKVITGTVNQINRIAEAKEKNIVKYYNPKLTNRQIEEELRKIEERRRLALKNKAKEMKQIKNGGALRISFFD